MNNKHEGCIKGYHRSNKAWYAPANNFKNIEVMFGMYHPKGGSSGEMSMRWIELDTLCPRLECFHDSWNAFAKEFPEVLQKLGEVDRAITEEEFVKLLDECGFKDLTAYQNPYEEKPTPPEDMVTVIIPKGMAKDLKLNSYIKTN